MRPADGGAAPAGGVVGILPAAGLGSRLGASAVSKELLPSWRPPSASGESLPLPACRCCLEAMKEAEVTSVLVPTRSEKWDLARYLERRDVTGVEVALVLTGHTRGPVESIASALRFVPASAVAFGFPDIIFQAANPFGRLLERLDRGEADGILGLFPHPPGRRADSVSLTRDGRIERIDPAAPSSGSGHSWALAVWSPEVSRHLSSYPGRVPGLPRKEPGVDDPRLKLGAALQSGIEAGMRLDGLRLSESSFIDIGEPRGWAAAIRALFREGDEE